MMTNFLLYSKSCLTYSRKRLNGGFVTTMSDSLSRFVHSSLRKPPSPSRGVHSLCLFARNCLATSFKLNSPSPSMSCTSLIMNLLAVTFGRPFDFVSVLSSPYNASSMLATGEGLFSDTLQSLSEYRCTWCKTRNSLFFLHL